MFLGIVVVLTPFMILHSILRSINNSKEKFKHKRIQELLTLKAQRKLTYPEYDTLRTFEKDSGWINLFRIDKEKLYDQYLNEKNIKKFKNIGKNNAVSNNQTTRKKALEVPIVVPDFNQVYRAVVTDVHINRYDPISIGDSIFTIGFEKANQTLVVPDLGDFEQVEVIEVHINAGDNVDIEDPLVTLETDKATMEVPAVAAGVIKSVAVKVGDTISQGHTLGTIDAISLNEFIEYKKLGLSENNLSVKINNGEKCTFDITAQKDGLISFLFAKAGDKVSSGDILGRMMLGKGKKNFVKAVKKKEELPKLDVLASAEIAKSVIMSFDINKILGLADFFSDSELQEAIESLHKSLRPKYKKALVDYYQKNLGITDISMKSHIRPQLKRCMELGLNAILKDDRLQSLFVEKPKLRSSQKIKQTELKSSQNIEKPEIKSSQKIEKKRTWKEISSKKN